MRKTCQYRNEEEERKDFHVFRNKSKDAKLKKKLLPSIYEKQEQEQEEVLADSSKKSEVLETEGEGNRVEKVVIGNKKKKKNRKRKAPGQSEPPTSQAKKIKLKDQNKSKDHQSVNPNNKKKKKKGRGTAQTTSGIKLQTITAYQANKTNLGKSKSSSHDYELTKISDDRLKAYGMNPNQVKRKLKNAKFKNAAKQA